MKTSFKQAIAWVSILALIAMNAFSGVSANTVNLDQDQIDAVLDGTNKSPTLTWDTVTVTATVLPILSMELSTTTLDFGELEVGVAKTVNLDVTTASNAAEGITVSVASTWLATWDTNEDKHIWALQRVASVATTWNDRYQIKSNKAVDWRAAEDLANVALTQNVLEASNVAESNTITNVALEVQIDGQTEAWNYTDTLTFTVTWRF